MSHEINAHLRQLGSYGQQREYQIVDGRNIRIAIGNKSRHKVFNVPMLALAEKSKIRLHIAWTWLWLALCGSIAIPAYVFVRTRLGLQTHLLDLAIFGALVVAVLVGLVMVAMNFSRKRVYFTACSKVPLFDILIGKPDSKSYKEFLAVFDSYLNETRSNWNLKPEQQIAGEVRMLRRLASEGVIGQKLYETAKDKLFAINKQSARSAA